MAQAGLFEKARVVAMVAAVFEQDGLAMGMRGEDFYGFGAAVASETDNSDGDRHGD